MESDPALQVFQQVKASIVSTLIAPLVLLLFAVALLLFLWGVVKYLWGARESGERKKGTQHMIWGVIGMGIMLSVFGLLTFVFNVVTFNGTARGINNQPVNTPSVIEDSNF